MDFMGAVLMPCEGKLCSQLVPDEILDEAISGRLAMVCMNVSSKKCHISPLHLWKEMALFSKLETEPVSKEKSIAADQTIYFVGDLHLGDGSTGDAFKKKDAKMMDFIKMVRNERRSIAHRTPSRTAVTVAARGLEYMSANSPKPGVVQHDVPHEHTRDGDLELFW